MYKFTFNKSHNCRLFRQIATAVYYCHIHKICHRDLKLENVLLDDTGSAKVSMLIAKANGPIFTCSEIQDWQVQILSYGSGIAHVTRCFKESHLEFVCELGCKGAHQQGCKGTHQQGCKWAHQQGCKAAHLHPKSLKITTH